MWLRSMVASQQEQAVSWQQPSTDYFSKQIPDIPQPPVPDKMARVRAAHPAEQLTAVWLHCSRKLDHNEL